MVLLLFGMLYFTLFPAFDRKADWREIGIRVIARALQEYDVQNGELPYSGSGSPGALFALEPYLTSSTTIQHRWDGRASEFSRDSQAQVILGAGYVLWVDTKPQSLNAIRESRGQDFIIAAESYPVRMRFPRRGKDLFVTTASLEVANIRCDMKGDRVVGTRLSEYEVLWNWNIPVPKRR